jgi:hypothetical protein
VERKGHTGLKTHLVTATIYGPVTAEAVAAIEPADATGRKMIREITKLPMRQQMRAFQEGEVFRLLAQLNPSLVRGLVVFQWHEPVPETPRSE